MSHRGKLSIVILGLAVAGGALRPSSAIAKKWYEYTDSEIIPPAKTTPDNRTFIVIGFSYKGRYFTNNKKYVWRKHTSRGSAITNWKQWKRDGLGVHITWSTRGFGQTADIEKKAKDIYYAKYAAKYSKSPTPRPTAPSAASVAGATWYNRQEPPRRRIGGFLRMGGSRSETSRGLRRMTAVRGPRAGIRLPPICAATRKRGRSTALACRLDSNRSKSSNKKALNSFAADGQKANENARLSASQIRAEAVPWEAAATLRT